jgi:hypothetical protein
MNARDFVAFDRDGGHLSLCFDKAVRFIHGRKRSSQISSA